MSNASVLRPVTGRSGPDYSDTWEIMKWERIIGKFSYEFVELPMFSRLLGEFKSLQALGVATKGRPQLGLRCTSASGSGKSAVARYYARSASPLGAEKAISPVLYVKVGDSATAREVVSQILKACGSPFHNIGTRFRMRDRLEGLVDEFGIEMLILDEIGHLMDANSLKNIVNFFKSLLEDAIFPIVFIGTEEALPIFCDDPEMGQRMKAEVDIAPLSASASDLRILAQFLKRMNDYLVSDNVFDEPSDFLNDLALESLFEVSQGHIGRVARTLQAALRSALYRNARRIELYDLAEGIDRWAVAQKFVNVNPLRREVAR